MPMILLPITGLRKATSPGLQELSPSATLLTTKAGLEQAMMGSLRLMISGFTILLLTLGFKKLLFPVMLEDKLLPS